MKYAIVLAVTLGLMSAEANALGKREQGALAGVFGTLILTDILSDRSYETYPSYPTTVHRYPDNSRRTFHCNKDEITCAYERGVWERERREFEEAKRRAYECGRSGHCNF